MSAEAGKIDFSYYAGEYSDDMELNESVSDRFMQLSQIRHNIVIKQQDLSSGDRKKNDPKLLTEVKGSTYFMYLDDGAIAEDVARAIFKRRSKVEGSFGESYVQGVSNVMKHGLYGILASETLVSPYETSKSAIEIFLKYGVTVGELGLLLSDVAHLDTHETFETVKAAVVANTLINLKFNNRRGLDVALPPIPLHRGLRAGTYLAMHGNNLVQPKP